MLAAFIAYVILTSVLSLAATSIMGAMDYLPSNNGALTTVLRGAGITLDDPEKYRDLLIEC